jgi:hypothetical protein
MRRLAAWSGRLVLGLWLAWFGLLVGLVALTLRREWRRQVGAELVLPDSIASPAADSAPAVVSQGQPLQTRPEQHTDFVYSVVTHEIDLLRTGLVLFGPPGLLTVVWLRARRRRHPEAPS